MKVLSKITSFLIFLSVCSCGKSPYKSQTGMVWNTTYSIKYSSSADLSDSILFEMRRVELSLSPFNEKSLISAVNRGENVKADKLFEDVFNISEYVCSVSGGSFDPTIAPIVNLWGFGFDNTIAPTDSAITESLKSIGIRDCSIVDGYIAKKTPDTKFDFSAVAKGYGCDLIAEMFKRNGCHNFLIEIGGEIVARGENEKGRKWRVMIDAPINSNAEIVHSKLALVDLTDCGVATSGNYRNYHYDEAGKIISHTLSPVTGRPIYTSTLSATVIAPNCGLADALATACMTMSQDSALKMINSIEYVSALFVSATSDSTWVVTKTDNFPDFK